MRIPYNGKRFSDVTFDDNQNSASINLVDFNLKSLSFISETSFESSEECKISFRYGPWYKKKDYDFRLVIIRKVPLSNKKWLYGAIVNSQELTWTKLVSDYVSSLKPSHLKDLLYKNSFETRELKNDEFKIIFSLLVEQINNLGAINTKEFSDYLKSYHSAIDTKFYQLKEIPESFNSLECNKIFDSYQLNSVSKLYDNDSHFTWIVPFHAEQEVAVVMFNNQNYSTSFYFENYLRTLHSKVDCMKERMPYSKVLLNAGTNLIECHSNQDQMIEELVEIMKPELKELYGEFPSGPHSIQTFTINGDINQELYQTIVKENQFSTLILNIQKLPSDYEFHLFYEKIRANAQRKILIFIETTESSKVLSRLRRYDIVNSWHNRNPFFLIAGNHLLKSIKENGFKNELAKTGLEKDKETLLNWFFPKTG